MNKIALTYRTPEKIMVNTPCLFKIWAGDRYYIWKSKSVRALMSSVVDKQIAKEIEIPRKDSIFFKLVEHCRAKKIKELSVEIIANYPNNALGLLQHEYNILQASKKDKKCLNIDFVNHKSYPSWVSQDAINNFKIYYTKGKNVGTSHKDKNLRKFLNSLFTKEMDADQATEKILSYVKERYK